MYQEGYSLKDECQTTWRVIVENPDGSEHASLALEEDVKHSDNQRLILELNARYVLDHPEFTAKVPTGGLAATSCGSRKVLRKGIGETDVPVYRLDDQTTNAGAQGPAIVEGPFFTARVTRDWRFAVSDAGDLVLDYNG